MRHALYLPPFGELADPAALITIAEDAEAAGWDGIFLWDHILRSDTAHAEIADVWVVLAAMATRTERITLGPMITPPVRRRPQILARQAITLDHLSRGRLVLGLGLGTDTSRELSAFGEVSDARTRAEVLDEAAELLCELWSGELVHHDGTHFTADGVAYQPRPYGRERVPLWFAARGDARRPVRRAARYDGLFPIEIDEDGLRSMLDVVRAERGSLDGFDVAVLQPGLDLGLLEELGVTWAMRAFWPDEPLDEILAVSRAGPPTS
jgi:alkanesulfonate monooxygenase SsuD/methylene tetrahydromethanopterin reductase-like flavin-dependent oxidoreductase (luciferase family)